MNVLIETQDLASRPKLGLKVKDMIIPGALWKYNDNGELVITREDLVIVFEKESLKLDLTDFKTRGDK